MKSKKFVAVAIALVSAISLATQEITSIHAVSENQGVIDTYHESKKNLLTGQDDDEVSILDVLSNKKAVLDASKNDTTIGDSEESTGSDTIQDDPDEPTVTEPEEPTEDEEPAVITSSTTPMYRGIDVSKWQGTINWKKVKESGIDFAIIKAGGRYDSGGLYKDPYFEYNYNQCKEYGIDVGCYWYTNARNVTQAQEEVNYLLYLIDGKQFEYPVAFDIESSVVKSLSRTTITNITIAFCDAMESNKYYVSIYSNVDWFENYLITSRLTQYDKWLANYRTVPKYGSDFGGLWQNGIGQCAGVTGSCDTDYSYKNYSYIIKRAGLNGF